MINPNPNQFNHKIGECETCSNVNVEITLHYGNMWMCDSCWEKDQLLSKESAKPENVAARIVAVNSPGMIAIEAAKLIDNSISVRTDIFNAATIAIIEIKNTIDADANIVNKPYALAETLKNRFNHFKSVIFEHTEAIVTAGNEQKAIQVYLNNLANSLRAEEREKLKISDINYQPSKPKVVTPRAISTKSSKKIDKKEVERYARELGISAYMVQMVCVSKGLSPEQAANVIRKSIEAAKATIPAV